MLLRLQNDNEKRICTQLFTVLSLLQNIDAEVSLAISYPLNIVKAAVAYLLLCQAQQSNQRPRLTGMYPLTCVGTLLALTRDMALSSE